MTKRDDRPPGWRPEWREPKPRRGGTARARATLAAVPAAPPSTAAPPEPLPSPEQMRERAFRVLLAVAEDPDAQAASRVGACRVVLDALAGRRGGVAPDVLPDLSTLSDAELDELVSGIRSRLGPTIYVPAERPDEPERADDGSGGKP
jgi:hypothetical protein